MYIMAHAASRNMILEPHASVKKAADAAKSTVHCNFFGTIKYTIPVNMVKTRNVMVG